MKDNNIDIKFGNVNTVSISGLMQWDKGQTLTFLDDYISDGMEVQFYDGLVKIIQNHKISSSTKM